MTENLIIWPMIFMALATLYLYVPMSKTRMKMVREKRVEPAVFKLNDAEPAESRIFTNAIANQFEAPVLFYACVLAAYVSDNAGWVMVILAWAYMIAKLAHVYVHVTTNNLRHRRPLFMVSCFILIAMWLVLALQMLIG